MIGDLDLDCYVLEDGRRVFHKRGMARALGLKSEGGNAFMKTMSRKGIVSSLSPLLQEKIDNPINFRPAVGEIAHGYDADVLSEVAKAISRAAERGDLTPTQKRLSIQSQILITAFSKVGVVALIDEATGYQQIRDPGALRFLVQQYIESEKREWEKEFPDEFYEQLNRVYGSRQLKRTRLGAVVQNRPQHFAIFTRNYIYSPLENGEVLAELDRINPKIDHLGTRKDRFHQHLSAGYGIEKLRIQMRETLTILKMSSNKDEFKTLYKKRFPEHTPQPELPELEG